MKQQELLRLRFAWLSIGWGLVALVIYFGLSHHPPVDLPSFKFGDKLSHMIAYAVLMGWFAQIYQATPSRIRILAAFICLGVVIEFLQAYGGVRILELADMLANALGATLMFFATRGSYGQLLQRIEKRFFASSGLGN